MARPLDPSLITDELVASLVDSQYPELSGLEIGRHYRMPHLVAVRVGDHHGVMLPLDPALDPYFARVAGLIAPHLKRWTFPLSAPLFSGKPTADFPHHWAVKSWIEASNSAYVALAPTAAKTLGEALAQVHSPAPADAPTNPRTSGGLDAMNQTWDTMLEAARLMESPEGERPRTDVMDALWRTALGVDFARPHVWTHGNIHPRSVLSDQGKFAGLLWWYHWGAGDPCVDIGSAVMLIPTEARDQFLKSYGMTSAQQWDVAQGCELWCVLQALHSSDPFDQMTAWRRLRELELTTQHPG